jgi:hypothetical protein
VDFRLATRDDLQWATSDDFRLAIDTGHCRELNRAAG